MIKIQADKENKLKVYEVIGKSSWCIKYPTLNCQMYSIAGVQNILNSSDPLEALKAIQQYMNSNLILVDVRESYEESLLKIFTKEDFLVRAPYLSTSGSKMILFIIKTDKIQ